MARPVGQSKYELGIIGDTQARNLSRRIKYEFFGDWDKADDIITRLPQRVMKAVNSAVWDYAEDYHKNILIAITMGLSSWAPLSQKTLAYKSSHGYYSGFYQMRGVLIDAVVIEKHKRGIRVTISSDPQYMNKQRTLTASQVMNILEHGSVTNGIPARPLFGPVWKKMGGNRGFMKHIEMRVGRSLKKYL